ncbi:7775_t:CDS:2, partial [Racocetra fulgida]
EINSDSDNESTNEPVGRQFMGIWKEIELVEEVSQGIYKGICIHCNKEFNQNIAKVYHFNLLQIELKSKHTKNKELTVNDIYILVNSLFDNIEEKNNNSQDDEIDHATILDSIYSTVTTKNLKLEI